MMSRRIERTFDDSGNLIEEIYDDERRISSSITAYAVGMHGATKSTFDDAGKLISKTQIWWDYETDREVVLSTPGQRNDKPAGHWEVYVVQKGIRDDYRWKFVPSYRKPPVRSSRFDVKKAADLTAMMLPMLIGLVFAISKMPPLRLWTGWDFMTTIEWAYAGPIGVLVGASVPYYIWLLTGKFNFDIFGNLMVLVLLLGIFPFLFTILGWLVITSSERLFGLNSLEVQVIILALYSIMMLVLGGLAQYFYKESKGSR